MKTLAAIITLAVTAVCIGAENAVNIDTEYRKAKQRIALGIDVEHEKAKVAAIDAARNDPGSERMDIKKLLRADETLRVNIENMEREILRISYARLEMSETERNDRAAYDLERIRQFADVAKRSREMREKPWKKK